MGAGAALPPAVPMARNQKAMATPPNPASAAAMKAQTLEMKKPGSR